MWIHHHFLFKVFHGGQLLVAVLVATFVTVLYIRRPLSSGSVVEPGGWSNSRTVPLGWEIEFRAPHVGVVGVLGWCHCCGVSRFELLWFGPLTDWLLHHVACSAFVQEVQTKPLLSNQLLCTVTDSMFGLGYGRFYGSLWFESGSRSSVLLDVSTLRYYFSITVTPHSCVV